MSSPATLKIAAVLLLLGTLGPLPVQPIARAETSPAPPPPAPAPAAPAPSSPAPPPPGSPPAAPAEPAPAPPAPAAPALSEPAPAPQPQAPEVPPPAQPDAAEIPAPTPYFPAPDLPELPPAGVAPPPSAAGRWRTRLYGFVELDAMYDTTQSYGPASNNNVLARPGTYAGVHGRTQLTVNNSLVGVVITAPEFRGLGASGQLEVDFFGVQPSDATERSIYTLGSVRMRLGFIRLETPVVDVVAGQYYDLFAWGGGGFNPPSVAFLGVAGQVYHRQPQLRLSRRLGGPNLEIDVAAAATRPAQRDSVAPDLEAGVRLVTRHWKGAVAQGFGQPDVFPAAIGLSGVSRRFAVAEFLPMPGVPKVAYGRGLAINAFLPIYPVASARDRSNGLSLLVELTFGTGIADLYTGLTGGALFPTLSNPGAIMPPPLYRPNVDSGIVTFDANGNLRTIDWTSLLVSMQYHLPIDGGRVWASATYSRLSSGNIAQLTPEASRGSIFVSQDYFDTNLFAAVTPAVQIGLSYQLTRQVFGDNPFGTGPVDSHNHRFETALRFFF